MRKDPFCPLTSRTGKGGWEYQIQPHRVSAINAGCIFIVSGL